MRSLAAILFLVALSAGCASNTPGTPSASPTISQQSQCERHGGVWRSAVQACETQGGGGGGY